MAQRRMFSKQIVETDAFLDMPKSSQLLYFHLNMEADDDGFVSSPKKIMRTIGAGDDDFKILVAKRFILNFDSGVMVIKHWLIHNYIRKDTYQETKYLTEKNSLIVKENGSYSARQRAVDEPSPQVRLGKDRLGEDNNTETSSVDISILIKSFETLNPASKRFYGNKTQRKACEDLIENYGLARVQSVIEKTLPKTNSLQYFPTITTPLQLLEKWASLESAIRKYQSDKKLKGVADINKKNDI